MLAIDPARDVPRKLTITIVGDPAAVARALFDGVDTEAVDALATRMEREPRLMRRFGGVEIRHAPLILRAIGPVRSLGANAPASARPREHRPRPRRHRGSRARSPGREDPDPPPRARCAHCGADFTPVRRHALFCGAACKQAAYRRRHHSELADEVWHLRREGQIDFIDALLLLVAPPARVLELLGAA